MFWILTWRSFIVILSFSLIISQIVYLLSQNMVQSSPRSKHRSLNSLWRAIVSFAIWATPCISDSVKEVVTELYRAAFHNIKPPNKEIIYPWLDHRVSRSSAYEASDAIYSCISLYSPSYWIAKNRVPNRYQRAQSIAIKCSGAGFVKN